MDLKHKLASQSGIIFIARLLGAGLIFAAQAAIARIWGPTLLGEYLLVMAVVNIAGIFLPLGFETVGTYFAAEYQAKGQGGYLRRFMKRGYLHIGILTLLLLMFGEPIAGLLGEPGRMVASHWLAAVTMALATGTVFFSGALLVGLRRPFAGFFADTLCRPMLVVAAFILALTVAAPAEGLNRMLWILALGYLAVAAVHLVVAARAVRRLPRGSEPQPREPRRWWRFALPWVLVSLSTDFFFDFDLLLLSALLSREELAIFGVCTRIFALTAFGITAVFSVVLPEMFEREALNDRSGFNRRLGDANLVAAALAVLLVLVVAAGGPFAMMLFGPSFAVGAYPLVLLTLALVVRSFFGPAGLVLSMHNRPNDMLSAVVLGLGTLIVGNYLLVPPFGLMGAAVAALLAQIVWSVLLWTLALRKAQIDVSIMPRIRELLGRQRRPASGDL